MLAMRSKVRVSIAEIIMQSAFEGLLASESLEVAAARGRRAASASKRISGDLLDWASVGVWSCGKPETTWNWGCGEATSLPSLLLLRREVNDVALGLEPPANWAVDQARRWRDARRINLRISDRGAGTNALLAEVLIADRHENGGSVLLIDVNEANDYARALSDWASKLRRYLTPAFGAALARALELLETDIEGLRLLLGLPKALIIFCRAPGKPPLDYATWNAIATAPETTTIVVCTRTQEPQDFPNEWRLDLLDRDYDENTMLTLRANFPKSMSLLTAVTFPLHREDLSRMANEAPLPPSPQVLIDAPASGVILSDSVRRRMLAVLGPDAVKRAHEDYLDSKGRARRKIGSPLDDVRHLVAAERWTALTRYVSQVTSEHSDRWSDVDWIQLAEALEPAGSALEGINARIRLRIALKFVERQELGRAHVWLDGLAEYLNAPLDLAQYNALLSEISKGQVLPGSIETMWLCARRALEICEGVPVDDPCHNAAVAVAREYRLNLARLELYFKRDALEAKNAFERLIEEWATQEGDNVAWALAAARRNLGECLFEFEPFASKSENWDLAAEYLEDAFTGAQGARLPALAAEVKYSQSKLVERNDPASAIQVLDICIQLAMEAKHFVLYRIAMLRQYWVRVRRLGKGFDLAEFRAVHSPTEYTSWHAWAARVAAQSRLWAARKLQERHDERAAIELLTLNQDDVPTRAERGGSSDRRMLAQTYAGLAVMSSAADREAVWSAFLQIPWVAQSGEKDAFGTPEAVWASVT
jgi:hypothetical protein